MRKFKIIPLLLLLLTMATSAAAQKKTQKTYIPWDNGKLVVSEEGRYLKHENGAPFFWLGETGWLLPERLNRDEAEYYLEQCKRRGYNVIQVQTLNNVPSMNIYGQYSMIYRHGLHLGKPGEPGRDDCRTGKSIRQVFGRAL